MIIICLTVLENFSRKSRSTVSVREGQAVVLLCGPPVHYGGTLFYSGSSALPASVTIFCLSQQSLLFLTLLLFHPPHSVFCFSACPPLFAALLLELTFTVFLLINQKPFFFFLLHILLMSLRLPSHFLTLSSLSSLVWSVSMPSSITSQMLDFPKSHIFPRCGWVIFG